MGKLDKETYTHSRFKGLRNNVASLDTDDKGLDDLEAAENVDLDDDLRLSRRKGHGSVLAAGAFRSLWSDGSVALAVRSDTSLVRVNSNYSLATLRSDLSPGQEMSYASIPGRVFYTNGVENGVVSNGASRTWGIVPPEYQPTAEEMGGVLPPGTYQYAVTFLRSDGQESGSQRAGSITLASQGGFRLRDFPGSDDPGVVVTMVYISKRDGETLYRAGRLAGATFAYQTEASMQVPLTTQHLRPPPAGQLVDVHNGRALVVRDDTLYPSEAFAPELFDLRKGLRMGGPIRMLAALDSGAYVGTDTEVVWLDGPSPDKWQYSRRLAYGAVRGACTVCSRDMVLDGQGTKRVAVFATERGLCVGQDGGEVSNLTQDRYAYPIQERGAVLVRRHRGMLQAVATLQGTERPGSSAL